MPAESPWPLHCLVAACCCCHFSSGFSCWLTFIHALTRGAESRTRCVTCARKHYPRAQPRPRPNSAPPRMSSFPGRRAVPDLHAHPPAPGHAHHRSSVGSCGSGRRGSPALSWRSSLLILPKPHPDFNSTPLGRAASTLSLPVQEHGMPRSSGSSLTSLGDARQCRGETCTSLCQRSSPSISFSRMLLWVGLLSWFHSWVLVCGRHKGKEASAACSSRTRGLAARSQLWALCTGLWIAYTETRAPWVTAVVVLSFQPDAFPFFLVCLHSPPAPSVAEVGAVRLAYSLRYPSKVEIIQLSISKASLVYSHS